MCKTHLHVFMACPVVVELIMFLQDLHPQIIASLSAHAVYMSTHHTALDTAHPGTRKQKGARFDALFSRWGDSI